MEAAFARPDVRCSTRGARLRTHDGWHERKLQSCDSATASPADFLVLLATTSVSDRPRLGGPAGSDRLAAPMTTPRRASPSPRREKTGIPKNPGRRDLGLQATLLFPDREIVEKFYVPLIYTACRTCYSEQDPDEIFRRAVDGDFDPLKMQKLIGSVIESGHGSTIEHIVFTFAISGVSRTLSHQLVRHRAGVAFDQQSQRYVKFKGAATMLPPLDRRGRPGPARALRGAGRRRARAVRRAARRPASRARTPGSSSRTRPGRTWS